MRRSPVSVDFAFAALLSIALVACAGEPEPGGTPDAQPGATDNRDGGYDAEDAGSVEAADAGESVADGGTGEFRLLTPWVVGMRHPNPGSLVWGRDPTEAIQRFYLNGGFPDEFDFLFFFASQPNTPSGLYQGVNEPLIPGLGVDKAYHRPLVATKRLQGFISIKSLSPRLLHHELLHRWAVNLVDPELKLAAGPQYPHWNDYFEVDGMHGGLDPDSVRCVPPDPEGLTGDDMARPPCDRDEDGLYTIYRIFPIGYPDRRYAPIELYLMGLATPDEIPPSALLRGVKSEEGKSFSGDWGILMRAEQVDMVTGDDIVKVYGLRPLAKPEERAFRAAFVLVTADEPSPSLVESIDKAARTFGCNGEPVAEPKGCFHYNTYGRATMDTRVGP